MIDNWWLLPLGFLFDFLYIVWYWSAEKEKAIVCGLASVALVAISVTGILEAIDNRWNLIPYFIGLFLGSAIGVKAKAWWNRRENRSNRSSAQ